MACTPRPRRRPGKPDGAFVRPGLGVLPGHPSPLSPGHEPPGHHSSASAARDHHPGPGRRTRQSPQHWLADKEAGDTGLRGLGYGYWADPWPARFSPVCWTPRPPASGAAGMAAPGHARERAGGVGGGLTWRWPSGSVASWALARKLLCSSSWASRSPAMPSAWPASDAFTRSLPCWTNSEIYISHRTSQVTLLPKLSLVPFAAMKMGRN